MIDSRSGFLGFPEVPSSITNLIYNRLCHDRHFYRPLRYVEQRWITARTDRCAMKKKNEKTIFMQTKDAADPYPDATKTIQKPVPLSRFLSPYFLFNLFVLRICPASLG
jgi:hypothetical protein